MLKMFKELFLLSKTISHEKCPPILKKIMVICMNDG